MKNLKFNILYVYVVFVCAVFLNSSKVRAQCNVKLPKDFIECNNSAVSIQSNTDYAPIYSTNDASDRYFWTITGGPFSYFGGTNRVDRYPKVNLQDGYIYQIVVRFTNSFGVCSDTQVVYRNVGLTAEINNPVQADTTVCQSSQTFSLLASVEGPYTSFSWSSTGTGTFTNPNTFSPTYTLSAADKANGTVKIVFNALANVNGSCFPNDTDTLTINILNLIGTDSSASVCSNNKLDYQPVVNGANHFTWTSQVVSGSVSGNSASGTGKISDSLINNSTTTDAVVRYTITPVYLQCSGAPFSYLVTIKPKPSITASNNPTLCTGSPSNIQLTSSISNTLYTWTSTVTTGSVSGNSNANTPVSITSINDVLVNNSPSNTASVRYTITPYHPFGCIGQPVDALISLLPQVTQADAGPARIICLKDTIHLNGNSPASGSGVWSQLSGPGTSTINQPTNPTSTVTNLHPGTYNYIWTISNGVCPLTRDTVTINISSPVVAGMLPPTADGCTGSNSGNFTLTNFNGNINRWEYSINAGQTWVNINNTTNVQTYSNLTSTTWYRAIVESGACGFVITDTAVVTVYPVVTTANAGSDRTLCLKDSIHLNANTPTVGTGSWSQVSGPNSASINQQTNPTTSVTNLQPGIYIFAWSISNGVCPVSTDTVRINISTPTIPGTLSGSTTVCTGSNSGSMTLNSYSGSIINWEYSNNGGQSWIALTNTTATQTYSNLTATTWYRTTVQNGACISAFSDTAVITVMPFVTPANAGVDRTICLQDSIHLSANIPTSGTGTWSQLTGPNTALINQQTNASTSVSNIQPGTYRFVWTISNAVCPSSSDTVTINISTPTLPGTLTGNATVCTNSNTGTIVLNNYTGNVINWEFSNNGGQTWINIVNATNTYTYSNLTSTTWYRATVKSGACAAAFSDTAIVTVMPLVTPANAGSDKAFCISESINLNGNTPASGSGTWSQLSGPTTVIISQPNNPATSVTNVQAGSYRFIWTIGNGICPSNSDTVSIDISSPVVAGMLPPKADGCVGSNSGSFTLTNFSGNVNRWEYTINGGQTWTNISNTTSVQTYSNLNTTTWYRAVVESGACGSVITDTAVVTVYPLVTPANAGADTTICLQQSINLYGNTPVDGTGSWEQLSGPTTVIIDLPSNATATISNLQPGGYKFIWTIGNGICPPSNDTVTVNISTPTLPGTLTGNATVCTNSNGGTIVLNNYTGDIINWEFSNNGGQSWTTIINTTNTHNYSNLTVTTWYRVSVKSGACAAAFSDTAIVTVMPLVTPANAGLDRVICLSESINLNANIPTSGNGTWSQVSGPNTASLNQPSNPATSVTNLQPGIYSFVWTIANAVCPSSSDTVIINISTPTIAGILTGDTAVCTDINSGSVVLNNYTGTIINWEYSINGGQSWTDLNNTTNTYNYSNLTTTTWYRAVVKSGACAPAFSNTTIITVFPFPTKANAGLDRSVCLSDNLNLSGNQPTSGTGRWTQLSGPNSASINQPDNPATLVTNLQAGTYTFLWSIGNGVCLTSLDTVTITIASPVVAGMLPRTADGCFGTNSGSFTLSNFSGNINRWEYSTNGGQSWSNINNTTNVQSYSNLTATTWYRAVVESGACGFVITDTAVVTVYPLVTPANAGADRNICLQYSINLNGNSPVSGSGSWNQFSGPNSSTIDEPANPSTLVTNLRPGTYKYVWTISNNICPTSRDTVTITITDLIVNEINSTTQTVCQGASVVINSMQASGGNGTYQYQWERSYDGSTWTSIPGATQSSYTFTADTTVYLRRFISSAPCSSVSDFIQVIVQKSISQNTIEANQNICYGDNAAAIVGSLPTGGSGSYGYSWQQSIDGGNTWSNIAAATSKDLIPGVVVQSTLYRRIVVSGSCNGSFASISNSVLITVNPLAKAAFNVTTSLACAPFKIDSSIIKVERHNGLNKDYSWYANNISIGTGPAFPGYILDRPADSVIIKLKVTSLFNCKDDSLEYVMHVVPLPKPAFSVSDTIGCGPLSVSFTNQAPLASQYSYLWDFGNGQTSSSHQPGSVTFLPSSIKTDTTYLVRLTAFNNCDTVSFTKMISVRSKPKASFIDVPASGCSPLTVNFYVTINSTNSVHRLYFGDGTDTLLTASTHFSHVYKSTVTTTYYAKLMSSNECGIDSFIATVKSLNIDADLKFDLIDSAGCAPHNVSVVNRSTGTVNYTWNMGDGTPSRAAAVTDTIKYLYTLPGVYPVTLTAKHQCGDTSLVRYVYVHEVPKAAFSVALGSTCIGDAIKFTNNSSAATNYRWDFGDGRSSSSYNVAHSYSAASRYNISLTSIQQYSTGVTCSDFASNAVTIVDHLPGNMFVSDTTGVCLPFSVTFINRTQPSALTTWKFGDGNTATGDTVVHTYTSGGTFTATMNAQSAGGCVYTDTTSISVQPTDGTLVYNAANYCGNNNTRFVARVQNTDSLVWHFGDGTVVHTKDTLLYHSYKAGTYLPWAELIGKEGCRKIIKGADSIRVEELQPGFLTVTKNLCGSSNVEFTDTSRSFFGIQQWQWAFGDGTFGTGKFVQHQYNNAGIYQVRLIVTSKLGCTDTIIIPVNVVVHNKPVLTIQTNYNACVFAPHQFTANAQSADSVSSYTWHMGNGQMLQGRSVSAVYTTAGTFNVRLIAGTINGCYDTTLVAVTVHPLPQLVANKQLQICRGQQAVLQSSNATTVTWSNDQQVICSDCTQTTVSPLTTTKYYVAGSSQYGCASRDTVLVKVIQPFDLRISQADTICVGEQTQIFSHGAASCTWFPADGLSRTDIANPIAKPSTTTTYTVIGYDANNCFSDTGKVKIVVGGPTQIHLGADTTVMGGASIVLNSRVTNGIATKYSWSSIAQLSCNNCPEPVATIKKDECFSCTVTNQYGCVTADTVCIKTFCKTAQVFIPNAFSPDGDGVNDMFYVMGSGIKLVKSFMIFTRWGELVFQKENFQVNDPSKGWNGTVKGQKGPPEIYVYVCNVLCENDVPYSYKGNVAIIK